MEDIKVKVIVNTDEAVKDVQNLGDAFVDTQKDAKNAQNVLGKTNESMDLEPSINNLKKLKRELMNTAVGTKAFDELSMSIRDMEDAIGDAKKGNDDFLGQMENAPGILGMLGKGIRGAESATSSFGGALKATGIGLIVALLGGLASAFSGNEVAMKKIQPLFDGLKKITYGIFKVVEPLVDIFLDLALEALPYVTKAVGAVYSGMMAYFTFLKEAGGGAIKILKGVFTLDGDAISAGMDQVSGSFGKATESYKKGMKAMGEGQKQLTESEQEALEKQKELQEKQKEAREKAQADAKTKRDKELADRKAFNDSVVALEESTADKLADVQAKSEEEKLALQKSRDLEEINALKAKGADVTKMMQDHNALYKTLEEDLAKTKGKEKYEKEKADRLLGLETELADEKTGYERKKQIALEQQAIALEDLTLTENQKIAIKQTAEQTIAQLDADKKTKETEEKLLAIENDLANEATSFENQRMLINEREALLLEDKTLTDEQRIKLHADTSKAQTEIDEKEAKAKQDIMNAVTQSMDIASDLIGKNTVAGKSLAVASALMNTYQGITAGVKLGYPQAIPAVAMAAVTGFKAVKSILSTKIPNQGGGGGGGASASIAPPPVAMPNASTIAPSGSNLIAKTLTDQPPIKTFVVAQEVTTQQGLDRSIVNNASIG